MNFNRSEYKITRYSPNISVTVNIIRGFRRAVETLTGYDLNLISESYTLEKAFQRKASGYNAKGNVKGKCSVSTFKAVRKANGTMWTITQPPNAHARLVMMISGR